MAATQKQRELVAAAREHGQDTDLSPIAVQVTLVDGISPDSEDALLVPCMLVEPVANPVLKAFLEVAGATPIGSGNSWQVGFGENNWTDGPSRVLVRNARAGTVWPESLTTTSKAPRNLNEYNQNGRRFSVLQANLQGTPAWGFLSGEHGAVVAPHPAAENGFGGISIKASDRSLYLKVFTHQMETPPGLPRVPLNLRPAGKAAIEPKPVLATHAIAVLEWLQSVGVTVIDPDPAGPVAILRKRIAESVIAYPTPGKPALAEVSVGRKVRALVPSLSTPEPDEGVAATRGQVRAQDVEAALRAAPVVSGVVHEGTRDAGRLSLAVPFEDPRLRPYQQVAVGRHVTTTRGYLNASSPGMGKTVMALSGMRERAATRPGYRGLIVVEANVRSQWGPEAAIWFPGAEVVTIEAAKEADQLAAALAAAGDKPLVVITSYAMVGHVYKVAQAREEAAASSKPTGRSFELPAGVFADALGQLALFPMEGDIAIVEDDAEQVDEAGPNLGEVLLDTFWHDIIADEAEVLRNPGTKQGQAMWKLRGNAEVGVPLTGTPINRSVDDLGRLVAWARGDAYLFYGVKLSEAFDLTDDAALAAFSEAMGGVVFRADTSEVSDEMPEIEAVVMKLKPTAAEKALADAARNELKRVYTELLEAVTHAELLDPENPEYAQARDALRVARGAHLGGTTLARMASSDPAALLGSTSAGAALLAGQGLIEAATQQTGTKRAAVVADTVNRVRRGEPVLIFTEFATVAAGLIEDLDTSGVRVGAVLGGGGKGRDKMIEDFKQGRLDVLVCTSSGEKGLNLQRASTIVHYDLPWAPKGVLQRTGRALRLESKNAKVTLVFPLMEGTVEERVAATVVRRALEAMYALDKSRGVDITKTEIGLALGGLAESLGDTAAGRAHGNELMEITRQLVG